MQPVTQFPTRPGVDAICFPDATNHVADGQRAVQSRLAGGALRTEGIDDPVGDIRRNDVAVRIAAGEVGRFVVVIVRNTRVVVPTRDVSFEGGDESMLEIVVLLRATAVRCVTPAYTNGLG